jgi:hypothetical protein
MPDRAFAVVAAAAAVVPHPPHMCSLLQRLLLPITRDMAAVGVDQGAAEADAHNNPTPQAFYTRVPRGWAVCFLLHMPLPREEEATCLVIPLQAACHNIPLTAAGNHRSNPLTPTSLNATQTGMHATRAALTYPTATQACRARPNAKRAMTSTSHDKTLRNTSMPAGTAARATATNAVPTHVTVRGGKYTRKNKTILCH